MATFDAWLLGTGALAGLPTSTEQTRAALAARRIADKSVSLAFRTPAGVTLAAQSVRLEPDDRASMATSEAGGAPTRKIIVFGIRNHATLPDTDIKEGYQFNYLNDNYRCLDTLITIGEIQANFEQSG